MCEMTGAERAVIADGVERAWAEMMAGARALDPDRIRAGYVDRPTVAINGRVVETSTGISSTKSAAGSALLHDSRPITTMPAWRFYVPMRR